MVKAFSRNPPPKVHPNFAQTWEDRFLGLPFLVDVSNPFNFFLLGGGEWGREVVGFFNENPRGGGSPRTGGGGEGLGGCLREIWGGLNMSALRPSRVKSA